MLPQEAEDLSGLWSNNSSSVSLHDYTNISTQQHNDYDNRPTSLGLSDITVTDILEVYKHDTELLKHILRAKAEEDKRRAAEEIRRTEEARLQSKYLDLGYGQHKRFSDPSTFTNEFLSGSLGSLAVSSAEVIPDWLSFNPDNTINMLSPSPMATSLSQFDQTPPSPTTSYYRPPSPFPSTSFDVPFADLTISTTSSPEPSDSTNKLNNGYNSVTTIATASSSSLPSTVTTTAYGSIDTDTCQDNPSQQSRYNSLVPPPLLPQHDNTIGNNGSDTTETGDNIQSAKSSCKRTLSRTRSQRRPVLAPGKKKNRSIPLPPHDPTKKDPQQQLDHGTVMEALRAKLRRSFNPPLVSDGDKAASNNNPNNKSNNNNTLIWPTSLEQVDYPLQPMSPQGMLLLDLKNPRKVFPNNSNNGGKKKTTVNTRVAVVRRPKPFTSAHNHCEKLKDTSSVSSVSIK